MAARRLAREGADESHVTLQSSTSSTAAVSPPGARQKRKTPTADATKPEPAKRQALQPSTPRPAAFNVHVSTSTNEQIKVDVSPNDQWAALQDWGWVEDEQHEYAVGDIVKMMTPGYALVLEIKQDRNNGWVYLLIAWFYSVADLKTERSRVLQGLGRKLSKRLSADSMGIVTDAIQVVALEDLADEAPAGRAQFCVSHLLQMHTAAAIVPLKGGLIQDAINNHNETVDALTGAANETANENHSAIGDEAGRLWEDSVQVGTKKHKNDERVEQRNKEDKRGRASERQSQPKEGTADLHAATDSPTDQRTYDQVLYDTFSPHFKLSGVKVTYEQFTRNLQFLKQLIKEEPNAATDTLEIIAVTAASLAANDEAIENLMAES